MPWQHLNLLSGSKESLQVASFLQTLLKSEDFWNCTPTQDSVCLHRALSILWVSHSPPYLCRKGFVRGLSCLQLQWGPGAALWPAPACGWPQGAAAVVEALLLQGQLRADGWRALAAWVPACRVNAWLLDVGPSQPNQLLSFDTNSSSGWHYHYSTIQNIHLKKDKGNYMPIIAKHTTNLYGIGEKRAGVHLPAPWHQPEPGCFVPLRNPSNLWMHFPVRRVHLSAAPEIFTPQPNPSTRWVCCF